MLDHIKSLLELGEKAPPAIDYFFLPPRPQWVPDIALKKTHKNHAYWHACLSLHNLSSKVLPEIRIKLPFTPQFEPAIDTESSHGSGSIAYQIADGEIKFQPLDPNDRVFISFFLVGPECTQFIEPQVIVGDKLLSRGMRAAGSFKRRPWTTLLYTLPLLVAVGALASTFYVFYALSPLNPETKAVMDATERIAGIGCIPKAYEKAKVNETLLARHQMGEEFLLRTNDVVDRKDLFSKEYVVICEASK
jgi:hypothetical protein